MGFRERISNLLNLSKPENQIQKREIHLQTTSNGLLDFDKGLYDYNYYGSTIIQNPDVTLAYARRDFGISEPYKIYNFMLQSDDELSKVVNLRISSIIGIPYDFYTEGEEEKDAQILDFIRDIFFNTLQNTNLIFENILQAFITGFSINEVFYDRVNGYIVPVDVVSRYPSNYAWDRDYNLRFFTDNNLEGTIIPDEDLERLLIFRKSDNYRSNPYGKSIIGYRNYKLFKIKSIVNNLLPLFLRNYVQPKTLATYDITKTFDEEIKSVLHALGEMKDKAEIVLPNDWDVKTLFDMKQMNVNYYLDVLDRCDRQYNSNILGQVLETSGADKVGSYAQAKIQSKVRLDILQSDIKEFSDFMNTWIKKLVVWNYGERDKYPEILFDAKAKEDLEKKANVYTQLYNMGVSITERQIREEFNIIDATEDDKVLNRFEQFETQGETENNITNLFSQGTNTHDVIQFAKSLEEPQDVKKKANG